MLAVKLLVLMVVFAAVYVLINLVIDILYSFIDPRIRYS